MNQSVGWKRISMRLLSALAVNPASALGDRQLQDICGGNYPISHLLTLVARATRMQPRVLLSIFVPRRG